MAPSWPFAVFGRASAGHGLGGPAVRGLEAMGRRSAAVIRAVTLIPTVLVAVVVRDADDRLVVPVAAVLVIWSGFYVWGVRQRFTQAVSAVDAAVLSLIAVGSGSLTPAAWLAEGRSWLLPFLAFAGVAYQYSCARVWGVVCALAVAAAAVVGALVALPPGASASSVVSAVWSGATALLATLLWGLVRRGGARADAARADLEDARRRRRVAAALRADHRTLSAALHDTAASTLLMVGLGDLATSASRLAARARRDLEVLEGFGTAAENDADLADALSEVASHAALPTGVRGRTMAPVPPAVRDAIVGAATEALNNAARHALAPAAQITVTDADDIVSVMVVDGGRGFDPDDIAAGGRGLRVSIHDRMASVGGHSRLESTPGGGTTVRLEWRRGGPA